MKNGFVTTNKVFTLYYKSFELVGTLFDFKSLETDCWNEYLPYNL